MTITTPAETPDSKLASFGFTTLNYAKSRGSECSERSYNPHMLILAVQKLISQPQPVTAPGFWDTHFLSLNPETGTFRVDTKAPSFDKAAYEESLIPEVERARIAEIDQVNPRMKWEDYLKWNPDAGIEPPIKTVERVLSLEDIRFIFRRAMKETASLPDESLSSEQKIFLQQRLNDIAGSLRIELATPYGPAPSVKLKVIDSSMIEEKKNPEEIDVPLSLGEHSLFFRALLFSHKQKEASAGAGAGAGAATPGELELTLPDTLTVDDFKLYLLAAEASLLLSARAYDQRMEPTREKQLQLLELPNEKLLQLLVLCEYFDDSLAGTIIAGILSHKEDSITTTTDTVIEIVQLCQDGRLQVSSPIVQDILTSYINKLFEQAQRQEGGLDKVLSDLLEDALSKSTSLYDLEHYRILSQVPLKLRLRGALTNTALEKLSILFPNVASLDLSQTIGVSLLPHRWDNSLKYLNISNTGITRIDRPLPALEVFIASQARSLADISGLNGLTRLKEINISYTAVLAAPTGCSALEFFNAYNAGNLADITGLSGLTRLKEINISDTAVVTAPTGCSALESFIASNSRSLTNIAGLNGLTRLKEINISSTAVVAAPTGCSALESFRAIGTGTLTDISGLNGLTRLKTIDISYTAVVAAPTSCTGLVSFKADYSEQFTDATGLLNCSKLIYASLPDTMPRETERLFPNRSFIELMRSSSDEERLTMFRELAPHVQNRLKWFFWLFSGMPEGDPEFGTHLLERNPRDPAVEKTLDLVLRCEWGNLFSAAEIESINFLHKVLQDPESYSREKWYAFNSVRGTCQSLILHSIWVACGSDLSADPHFALNLVKDNPNSPVIKEVVAKLVRQLSG